MAAGRLWTRPHKQHRSTDRTQHNQHTNTQQHNQQQPTHKHNKTGNYAVSGSIEGCEAVERLGKSFKARMTVRLAVAGAFHTQYMAPAAEKLQAALAATEIVAPRIPVISNVDAKPHSDPAVIKQILAQQVGWRDSCACCV